MRIDDMCIDEVLELMALKQEGAYWDFKREWYSQDKKSDLLHDIICMTLCHFYTSFQI